jgi:hypothetical protein
VALPHTLVDVYCASYPTPPAHVTLDIDDTVDAVHGQQQLSFFNAFYDTHCFLPTHVYDTATARPVAVILRSGSERTVVGRTPPAIVVQAPTVSIGLLKGAGTALTMRCSAPKDNPLRNAEFNTLRLRLVKVAARIGETAHRVRIAFASACPDAMMFRGIAMAFQPAGP